MATTIVETNRAKYGGTDEEAYFDEVARNVTGIAYAGTVVILLR